MMVDGAEEGQFRGPIDVLAPYTTDRAAFGELRAAPYRRSSTSWPLWT